MVFIVLIFLLALDTKFYLCLYVFCFVICNECILDWIFNALECIYIHNNNVILTLDIMHPRPFALPLECQRIDSIDLFWSLSLLEFDDQIKRIYCCSPIHLIAHLPNYYGTLHLSIAIDSIYRFTVHIWLCVSGHLIDMLILYTCQIHRSVVQWDNSMVLIEWLMINGKE